MITGSNLCSTVTSITPRYDDAPLDAMTFVQSVNSTGSPTASAPMMPLHAYKPYIICMYSYKIMLYL